MAVKDFYVYLYLNPLKPGRYSYPSLNCSFLYEPMYIGKGHGNRYLFHITCAPCKKYNSKFIQAIREIINENFYPFVIKLYKDITERESLNKEIELIKVFGRKCLGTGSLLNSTRGGNGVVGYFFTKEHRKKLSIKMSGDNNPASKINMPYVKLKDKAAKAALTTKRLGLLRGRNHPLFGIGHTKKSCKKISKNHAFCGGKFNSRAKKWQVYSPSGEVYMCHGDIEKFCIVHGISHSTLKRNRDKGPVHTNGISDLSKNTQGWSLVEL